MGLRKRKQNESLTDVFKNKNDNPHFYSNFNDTNDLNPSHWVDEDGNFNPREIDYEMIDKAVYDTFDQRFVIASKPMPVILLDRDFLSVRYENYQQYDKLEEYLTPPFFTMYRSGSKPLWRVSPTNKQIIYSIPKQKESGLVYEVYKMPPPRWEIITYEFKFISNYRERSNSFENQMNQFFQNKRNHIMLDTGDRFEIKTQSQDERGTTEKVAGSTNEIQRVYEISYVLEVIGYLRNADSVEKSEKKSNIEYDIVEKSERGINSIQRFTTKLKRK